MKPLVLAALMLSLAIPALARGGGGDGGGSFSGGGSGYGSSSGYGGGYYSGGYSSRHRTSNAELIFYMLIAGGMAAMRLSSRRRFKTGPGGSGGALPPPDAKGTDALMESVSSADPDMDPGRLKARVSSVFLQLQQCWAAGDYSPMRPLLTPHLYAVHEKKLADMRARGEINRMDAVQVLGVNFAHLSYTQNPENRSFTALVRASARDYYVDQNESFLRGDDSPKPFAEYWTFRFKTGSWLLDEIEQPGASGAPGRANFCWNRAGEARTTFSEPDNMAAAPMPDAAPMSPSGAATLAPFTPRQEASPLAPIAPIAPITPLTLTDLPSPGVYAPAPPPAAVPLPPASEAVPPPPPPPLPGRELTPRPPADRNWSRTSTELAAAMAFLNVYGAWEKGAFTPDAEAELLPAMRGEFAAMMAACRAQGLAFKFEDLSVARAEVALVKSSPPAPEEEFVARITARAVKTLIRNGKTMHRDAAISPFTEYWVFAKNGGRWKLKELLPRANGKIVLKQDDQETDSSPVQMEWYYKNGAAA